LISPVPSESIMEKGCSVASSNCESAEDAQQELSELKPKTPQPTQPPQPKPSTSQVRLKGVGKGEAKGKGKVTDTDNGTVTVTESMSKLREDVEDCVSSNSQHGFAVVLDDESSTETGVLETFEISSSNSLPTSTGASAASTVGVVVVPVDDSSSTDTLNGNENGRTRSAASEDHSVSASSMNNVFFNDNDNDNEPPVVCLINDDDDFDEEEIVEDEDDVDDDEEDVVEQSMPIDCPNTSQINGSSDGIIMTADGSKIFLETPVVDEPQSHAINHPGSTVTNAAQSELLTGKPKRLSDEFDAEARSDDQEQEQDQEAPRGVKSDSGCGNNALADVASTSLHDRQMSVRLKQMSLTANTTEATGTGSMSGNAHTLSKADIESMDRIERRDFETEQRLTGGIVLGTSKLISKNRLNLSLINPAGAGAAVATGAGTTGGVSSSSSDDWPSSSNGRAFSSDSKVS